MNLLRTILAVALAGTVLSAHAADGAQEHCLYGCPIGTPATNNLVVRSVYALSSNDDTKFADWVAYRVTKTTIGPERGRNWKADPELRDEETLEPDDYAGAAQAQQMDLGHLAPLASLSASPEWAATNYLSNIVPQHRTLNRGAWSRLEAAERQLAKRPGVEAVWVLTGPIYKNAMPALPGADETHRVPSAFWKIVATMTGGRIRTVSFVMTQDIQRGTKYCDRIVPIEAIEQRTGLRIFPDLRKVAAGSKPRGRPLLAVDLGCSDDGQ